MMEDLERVLEGLATTPVHVTVQAPGSSGVVESRPNRADHNFSRTTFHFFVKAFQVLLAPVAAIGFPAAARMHPGVIAIEIFYILRRRFIFVNQNRRMFPLIQRITDPVPIGVAALGKNEN